VTRGDPGAPRSHSSKATRFTILAPSFRSMRRLQPHCQHRNSRGKVCALIRPIWPHRWQAILSIIPDPVPARSRQAPSPRSLFEYFSAHENANEQHQQDDDDDELDHDQPPCASVAERVSARDADVAAGKKPRQTPGLKVPPREMRIPRCARGTKRGGSRSCQDQDYTARSGWR